MSMAQALHVENEAQNGILYVENEFQNDIQNGLKMIMHFQNKFAFPHYFETLNLKVGPIVFLRRFYIKKCMKGIQLRKQVISVPSLKVVLRFLVELGLKF